MCRVYPRVCGGTGPIRRPSSGPEGLSPRVRGNPSLPPAGSSAGGSIPACAGEPQRGMGRLFHGEVYPRVCGGTDGRPAERSRTRGLSPRVRGNRRAAGGTVAHQGSIPACAGEPGNAITALTTPAVYPRVCGGTPTALVVDGIDQGLSPRVRGNQYHAGNTIVNPRSIPACAGEPHRDALSEVRHKVYPRVCGGTPVRRHQAQAAGGLSPRVRGNPPATSRARHPSRSIPACAGEPQCPCLHSWLSAVYPRVCGGTRAIAKAAEEPTGLSPRVRGNQRSCGASPYH